MGQAIKFCFFFALTSGLVGATMSLLLISITTIISLPLSNWQAAEWMSLYGNIELPGFIGMIGCLVFCVSCIWIFSKASLYFFRKALTIAKIK